MSSSECACQPPAMLGIVDSIASIKNTNAAAENIQANARALSAADYYIRCSAQGAYDIENFYRLRESRARLARTIQAVNSIDRLAALRLSRIVSDSLLAICPNLLAIHDGSRESFHEATAGMLFDERMR